MADVDSLKEAALLLEEKVGSLPSFDPDSTFILPVDINFRG